MKSIAFVALLFCAIGFSSSNNLICNTPELDIPKEWVDMTHGCIGKMREQVLEELKASMQYMAMGAYFAKDVVNRPGVSEMFFKSASEERDHAIKLIHYLLMRGELTTNISDLIKRNLVPPVTTWENVVSAMKAALKLEADVTRKIRKVIEVCEHDTASNPSNNDYHLVDYLTGDFLEEQYHGQRDIAGKVSTLEKMMKDHGKLGEWLFDKKVQAGEL
ncbi:unnamed protein product [Phyllotreta striolata]|uniref:Ferritin n=1 Tax=Phyllotreta striolata TaxID=444603 RepID=A0A9N9U072_PHYSR|nr:unnamed protein product [Phyllotreta striolata]